MTLYTSMGLPHVIAALLAYISAIIVFFQPKGVGNHKLWGRIFAAAMLTVSTTGVLMYLESGRLSVFYVFAVLIYIAIARGIFHIRRYAKTGDREDLFRHYREMAGSFMGLNLAGLAQGMRYLPFNGFEQYVMTIILLYIPLIWLGNRWLDHGLRHRLGL